MKKRYWFFIGFLSGCYALFAQKHDHIWVLGYRYGSNTLSNGIYLTFEDSMQIAYRPKPMPLGRPNATICDSSGRLLLLSNGCYIETAEGQKIAGSDTLNPGIGNNLFCPNNRGGYNIANSMVLLPDPGRSRRYHFFHLPDVDLGTYATLYRVLHTVVEQQADSSWKLLYKSVGVVKDTMSHDGLHAVKHANGRDWWVVAPKRNSNTYYFLLLSPQGIRVHQQTIGQYPDRGDFGNMCFSPDGRRMARYGVRDDLILFDFDRCTGTLSRPLYLPIANDSDQEYPSGLAFSADSRFLYLGALWEAYQLDMQAGDIAGSLRTIGRWDPAARCPFLVAYAQMELGPDGRIYSRSADGQSCMHRIKNPEKAGTDSGVQYRHYELDYSFVDFAHFPNFRLGPIDGSACDTLGLDNHPLAGWRWEEQGLSAAFTSVSWYDPERWQWTFGDGTGSTVRHPAHVYARAGEYEVCLVVSNVYGSDTLCRVVRVGTVSTDTEPGWTDVEPGRLHPNPTAGTLQWLGSGVPATARVFDGLGRSSGIFEFQSERLELGHLPAGLYSVQVFDAAGGLLVTQKVILQR